MTRWSVGYGNFARHDGARAREPSEAREVADECEDGDEDGELDRVADCRPRDHFPHQPERGLREADGPDRPVEIAALVPLPLRGGLHTRKFPERAEQPDGAGHRKIRIPVDLLEIPLPGDDRE